MFRQITQYTGQLTSGTKGKAALTFIHLDDSSETGIEEGSIVEIAGASFEVAIGDTLTISGFSSITTGQTAYLMLNPSGTAGSQVVTAAWSATEPNYNDALVGWYSNSDSALSRAVLSCIKTSDTGYAIKTILEYPGSRIYQSGVDLGENGTFLKVKVLEIGSYDMTTGIVTHSVAYGLTGYENIVGISTIVINDGSTALYPIENNEDATYWFTATDINIVATPGNFFDSADFNGSGNRGYICMFYME